MSDVYRELDRTAAARTSLAEALELIDRDGCETFTGSHRCFDANSGRTRGAKYGADMWCPACIARHALNQQAS